MPRMRATCLATLRGFVFKGSIVAVGRSLKMNLIRVALA